MNIRDLPTIRKLTSDMDSMKLLLEFNGMLGGLLVPEASASQLTLRLTELRRKVDEHVSVLERFNSDFAASGWIVHDTLDTGIARRASEILATDGCEAAEAALIAHYSPQNIGRMAMVFNGPPELKRRIRFIEHALEDYRSGRFISCIPVLLMVIDGAVNEAARSGMHSERLDLDVWDSVVSVDDGISQLHRLFTMGRYKTRDEPIDIPYRNGILHGMDLGYDNVTVAAKCWHLLFVVKDWLNARRTAQQRKDKLENETRVPDLPTISARIARTSEVKRILTAWKPRVITQEYLSSINGGKTPTSDTPEEVALEYLELWRKKNYGFMDKLHWRILREPGSVKHTRERFSKLPLESYSIQLIVDEAPVISEVTVCATIIENDQRAIRIRLVYGREDEEVTVPELGDGKWWVVSCSEQ